jgi:hypothetical protein
VALRVEAYMNSMCRLKAGLIPLGVLAVVALASAPGAAQQWSGCFVGQDYTGAPTQIAVFAERYNDWFEIGGQIHSASIGLLRFKADGHSGAGRLFSGHEYEAGALYIHVIDLNENVFVLEVEGYGVFQFRRANC